MMDHRIFSGHQPNFVPYLGVFYKIMKSDVFVLDDDVQYSRDGLHNANFVRVGNNRCRITVPVNVNFGERINEARICYDGSWSFKILKTLEMNYGKCDFFDVGMELMVRHLRSGYELLSDMNIEMIKEISARFGFNADIVTASKDVPTELKNNERNIFQCKKLGCDVYYSGVGGKAYNDEEMYRLEGIKIVYSDFAPNAYKQKRKKEFMPNLSVIDYIMNEGFKVPYGWSKGL